jgi:hypothetical protein
MPTANGLKLFEATQKARDSFSAISKRAGVHNTRTGEAFNFLGYGMNSRTNVTIIMNPQLEYAAEITLNGEKAILPKTNRNGKFRPEEGTSKKSKKSHGDTETLIVTFGQADDKTTQAAMCFLAEKTQLTGLKELHLPQINKSHETLRLCTNQIVTPILKVNGDENRENHRETLSAFQPK